MSNTASHWNCKVCKTTMPIEELQAHLSGVVHANSLARKSPQKPPKARAHDQTWNCTVCDITVSKNAAESHQAGKRHLQKLRAQDQAKSTSVVTSPPAPGGETQPTQTPPKPVSIHPTLQTKKPTAARQKPTVGGQKSTPNSETKKLLKVSAKHAVPRKPLTMRQICVQMKPTWWTCTRCNITMYAESRESHKDGKCKGVCSTPVEFKPSAKKDPLTDRTPVKKKPSAVHKGLQKRLDSQQRTREQRRDGNIGKGRERKNSIRKGTLADSDSE